MYIWLKGPNILNEFECLMENRVLLGKLSDKSLQNDANKTKIHLIVDTDSRHLIHPRCSGLMILNKLQ